MMVAVALFVRWITLGALAGLIGGLVLTTVVLPPDDADLSSARRRPRAWHWACVATLVVAAAAELLLRARTLAGSELAHAVRVVPQVLSRTHFGTIWLARVIALAALAVLGAGARPFARGAALAAAAGVALTTTLIGHAADWGDLTPTVMLDRVHVLAASLWVGGLVALALVVFGGASPSPTSVTRIGARFSRLAAWSLITVVLTGAYNAWVQLPDVAALWNTFYGRVLLAKLALVAGLVALGATNRYALLPRLMGRPARGVVARGVRRWRLAFFGPGRVSPARLVSVIGCEAALGIAVFGLTAALGETTPARHAGHVAHVADVNGDREPIHATLEGLHETGGVPRGWTF